MSKKIPWLAAVLNFVIPGAGYVYVGNRVKFGVLLLAGMALMVLGPSPEYVETVDVSPESLASDPGFLVMAVASLLMALGFAYDGYRDAKHHNMQFPAAGNDST